MLGNFLVALLAALSVLIVLVFEPHLYLLARPADYYIAGICSKYIAGISLFAFTLTMVREIIKDIEDREGDRQYDARTIPVAWGLRTAKIFSISFVLITIGAFGWLYRLLEDANKAPYLLYLIAMTLFLMLIGARIIVAEQSVQFKRISLLLKVAMLGGLTLMPIYFILEF